MKIKKFVVIAICILFLLFFYLRQLMVELIKAYLVPICISIIGGISLKVISWLFKRVKAGISKPMKVILQKDCENCKGKGYILCGRCGGTGNVEKEVAYSGTCKVCNGSGLVKTTCPTCFGNKAISRTLRFQIISSESKVDGILFWPRTQTVSIKVRNLDEKAGYFWAYVNLKDPSELSKKSEGIYIKPGEINDIKVSFPVNRWEGYSSTFDVQAEALPFTCPTCGGLGYSQRPCITCGGTGQITEKKRQMDVCPICGGRKEILCKTCQGTGKVPRFA